MFICCLMVPILMMIIGLIFMKKAPKKINIWYGYRTSRSMKNSDTWDFANKHCAKMFLIVGAIMTVVSAIVMLAVIYKSEDVVSIVGTVVTVTQVVGIVLSVIPTERALRREFDEDGNRKNNK